MRALAVLAALLALGCVYDPKYPSAVTVCSDDRGCAGGLVCSPVIGSALRLCCPASGCPMLSQGELDELNRRDAGPAPARPDTAGPDTPDSPAPTPDTMDMGGPGAPDTDPPTDVTGPAPDGPPAKLPAGAPCTGADACSSNQCVDGICCDRACDGACQSCVGAHTGLADGTCGPVKAGVMEPHQRCKAEPPASCSTDGACGADGACRRHGTSVACGEARCQGNAFVAASKCDGLGACKPAAPEPCGAFTCAPSGCSKACTGPGDCAASYYCASGTCRARQPAGQACADAGQCQAGLACVDGVCCDSACTGPCQSCRRANTGQADGTCAPVSAGGDPDNDCAPQEAFTCGRDGACDGAGACRLHPATTTCGNAVCGNNAHTPARRCTGAGVCQAAVTTRCRPGETCVVASGCTPQYPTCANSVDCREPTCFEARRYTADNEVVVDHSNGGRLWRRNGLYHVTLAQAEAMCAAYRGAGVGGWRVPSGDEMGTIKLRAQGIGGRCMPEPCCIPALDQAAFRVADLNGWNVWVAGTLLQPYRAMDFTDGRIKPAGDAMSKYSAMCVHDPI